MMVPRPHDVDEGVMARTRRLAILALVVSVMAGCGGSATTPSPLAPTTLAPTPTPSPSADLAALVSAYQTIASNTTAARGQCAIDKDAAAANLTSARAAAQKCLNDFSQVVADFEAIDWGPVQPQAESVIAAIDTLDTLAGQMAGATTVAAFRVAYDQLTAAEVKLLAAVNPLRAALGLPPE
ncbi:MAG: hypothetical protein ACHQ15_04445 [Candidatus Limnocylindrales bacterium]